MRIKYQIKKNSLLGERAEMPVKGTINLMDISRVGYCKADTRGFYTKYRKISRIRIQLTPHEIRSFADKV